jgi:WD40 repeat protein
VWNPTDGQQLKALPSAEPVRYAVVSDDGRVVVALILPPLQHRVEKSGVIASFYPPRSLLYWEVDTGVHRLLPDSGFAEHLALARDGTHILVTARQSPGLVVRELGGGPPILALNEAASLVAMSPERSMLAVAGLDGRIRLLQWPSRRLVDTLGGYLDSALTALAFSRNGSRLVSATQTEILIWDFQGQRGSAVAPR